MTERIDQMAAEVGNIDLVYEATGASQLAFDVLKILGTNGLFILTGVPGSMGRWNSTRIRSCVILC